MFSPSETFYALPFYWSEQGELVPGAPQEVGNAMEARGLAFEMAMAWAGAIAFSRIEVANHSTYQNAIILAEYGDVNLRRADLPFRQPLVWWVE
jgi:hypothetical protein